MVRFKVNQKVHLPELDKDGIVRQVVDGKPKLVEVDGQILDVTEMIVERIVTDFISKYIGMFFKWLATKLKRD